MLPSIIALGFGLAGLAGVIYQAAAALLVRRFMAAPRRAPSARPAMSVLKPLCGDEPGLADNLESLFDQDYPAVQVICGVAAEDDPAVALVRGLAARRPDADLTLVVDGRRHGCNLKVGNLLNMAAHIRHPVVVIADSDVYAYPGYLDDLAAGLECPGIGLVTSLYVGRPTATLWSRLGALGINHGFLPSALVARALGRRDGCFGATMALPHALLDSLGGFPPLAEVLADDWVLGAMVRRAGLGIGLAVRPVDLSVHEPDAASLLAHEIRWGRTIAAVDRPSYLASVITQPLVPAALAAAFGGPSWLALLAAAALVRWWAIRGEERALGVEKSPLVLMAMREVLNFLVFVAACSGRSVWWRGKRFRIRPDGTLEHLEGISA